MAKRKSLNPMVVIENPSTQMKRLGEGKLRLMDEIQEATAGGLDLVTFLVNLIKDGDKDSVRLEAVKILLAYGFGKPVETSVSAKVEPQGSAVNNLTDAQLEALIGTKPSVPKQTETDADLVEPESD